MNPAPIPIRPYTLQDEADVIALWQACDLVRPWNNPQRDIARKLSTQPELFLVAVQDQTLVGTAMVGYDGHRGWVNYLAVQPLKQGLSIGRSLMQEAERLLKERGCPKLNLQVRTTNTKILGFYARLGYVQDDVVSLGKRLIPDE
jgi:ribosomal protein S18 acetylase RimI-like enzyme